jgi:hypothetical protein
MSVFAQNFTAQWIQFHIFLLIFLDFIYSFTLLILILLNIFLKLFYFLNFLILDRTIKSELLVLKLFINFQSGLLSLESILQFLLENLLILILVKSNIFHLFFNFDKLF